MKEAVKDMFLNVFFLNLTYAHVACRYSIFLNCNPKAASTHPICLAIWNFFGPNIVPL